MPTPEETERRLVRSKVWRKTLLTAGIPSALIFLLFAVNGSLAAFFGFIFALGIFFTIALYGGLIINWREKKESKGRLADLAENKRLAQQQAEQAEKASQEQQRLDAIREGEERSRSAFLEQKRRNDREFVLTKLNAAANNINLYDSSASFETRARVMQVVENELSDIIVTYPRAELGELIDRYPEVRDMMVTLRERLRAKAIDSHQAAQIFAPLGPRRQPQVSGLEPKQADLQREQKECRNCGASVVAGIRCPACGAPV